MTLQPFASSGGALLLQMQPPGVCTPQPTPPRSSSWEWRCFRRAAQGASPAGWMEETPKETPLDFLRQQRDETNVS